MKYYPLELLEIVEDAGLEKKPEPANTEVSSDTVRGWYDCFYV